MKNVIALILFSMLTYGQLIAQYQFTTFEESDGLPDKSCRGMAVDSSGTMWVGTQGGVARWDGSGFVHVPINDSVAYPFVNVVKVAPDGNIWVGYLSLGEKLGLSVIDTNGNLLLRADSVLSGQGGTWVFDIEFGPDNLVYVAHSTGISTYDGEEWNLQTPASGNFGAAPVQDLLFAQDGSLWVATIYGLAHRLTNGTWENFYTFSSDLIGNNIRTLELDTEENLWIGTSKGLSIYDGEKFENYEIINGLENNLIRDIAFDELGHTWLTTDDGFSIFDGAEFQDFKTSDSDFFENTIRNVLIHNELGIWMTTREGMVLVEQIASSTDDKPSDLNTTHLEVFPNPTTGPLRLLWKKGGPFTVSIFSSQGRLLKRFELEGDGYELTTDLSSMPPGTYWLRIEADGGLLTRKIVKH